MTIKFGFTGKSEAIQKLATWAHHYIYNASATFGTIFITLGGAYAGNYQLNTSWSSTGLIAFILTCPFVYLALGAILLLLGALGIYKDQRELNAENERLKKSNGETTQLRHSLNSALEDCQNLRSEKLSIHRKLVETWLKGVFKLIGLDTKSRVTIYYESGESFYLLARHSSNPNLTKSHKMKFSLNQGVISQAWQHGEHSDDQCPDYSTEPEAYLKYMKETYDYEETAINNFTMRSCRYYALAITEADDNIGVILFESENGIAFCNEKKEKIKEHCNLYQSHLCGFLRDALSYDKSVNENRKTKGFDGDAATLAMLGDRA